MKARMQGTHSRTSTMVVTLTLNPIEAQFALAAMDVSEDSPASARTLFMYLLAIADENSLLKSMINNDARLEELWKVRASLTSSGES